MICSNCRSENPDTATFCDNCGNPLASPAFGGPVQPAVPVPPTQPAAACPNCHRPVMPADQFCGFCGASLSGMTAVSPPYPQAPAPPVQPPTVQTTTCGNCGAGAVPGQAFCDNCGMAIAPGVPMWDKDAASAFPPVPPVPQPSPSPLPPQPAPAPVWPGSRTRLVVAVSGQELDLTGKREVIVGREDPVSQVFPDIDLTAYGGQEGGVSRQHAKLIAQGDQWLIEDLNSVNFSYVNNRKLAPHVPQPLANGDQIRLGKVVLSFHTS